MVAKKKTPIKRKQLNLALQGGGAHGAFTWGVMDRLIEEEDVDICAISGTSAGAMNAAVAADGWVENGRQGAKDELARFWGEMSGASKYLEPWLMTPFGSLTKLLGVDYTPLYTFVDALTRSFSPYELNPLNINPLRDVLSNIINFDRMRACDHLQLFVTATNVETGQPRVFSREEITIDVLLASGCLPFIYQAVEIEGVPYWDGGYMGNPSIWPLHYNSPSGDVLLVQINPVMRKGTPKRALDIVNRLNEISFNSSLIAEMRSIQFVRDLIDQGRLDKKHYRHVNMHMIAPPDGLHEMTADSKMNATWEFFTFLHQLGRQEMEKWLKANKKMIGVDSTLDIAKTFLTKPHHATHTGTTIVKKKAHA